MQECLTLQPEEDAILDFDAIERWTVMHCPLFDKIFLYVLAASFGLDAGNEPEPEILPTTRIHFLKRNDKSCGLIWILAISHFQSTYPDLVRIQPISDNHF